MSTTATTTTTMTRMARNMEVKHTRRPRAAAHTAWLRHLVCAVSVAATLCCFIPGALSPFPMHIPAERGRKVVESWKEDKIENHPATMLDTASVLEDAFEILRENVPTADETLKQDFLAFSDPLKDSPKIVMAPEDVERYVGSRPRLEETMAKSLSDFKAKDFDQIARAVLYYMKYSRAKFRWHWSGSSNDMTDLIKEDVLKKKLKTYANLGFAAASFSKQDEYSEKPSDVSDGRKRFKAWVQAGVRSTPRNRTYEVKLTMHPNVKSTESEGTVITCYATYSFRDQLTLEDDREAPELKTIWFELKNFNFASPTGKIRDGWTAKTTLINGPHDQTIREYKSQDDLFLLCNNSTNSARTNSWTKSENYKTVFRGLCKPPSVVTEKEMTHIFEAEIVVPETTEEHNRRFSLEIQRDNDFGERHVKHKRIERIYTLINSDCLEKPFVKKPLEKARPDEQESYRGEKELKGKYTSKLRIYQRETQWHKNDFEDTDEDKREINIGMLVGDDSGWGNLHSPLAFNIEWQMRPQPDGSEKTVRVRRHLTYKSAEYTSVLHTCQVDSSGVQAGSYEYDTKFLFPLGIRNVFFMDSPKDTSLTNPYLGPKIFEDNTGKCTAQRKKLKLDDDSSETSSSDDDGAQSLEDDEQSMECEADVSIKGPDSEGKMGSLICNMLIDGGLFFFGTVTIFIILATGLESLRKRERVGRIQSQISDLS